MQSTAALHPNNLTIPPGTDLKDDEKGQAQADLPAGEEVAQKQTKLERLNQSMLRDLEKIVKENPPGADLWPYFRKANYKANRAKLVEKPEPKPIISDEPRPSKGEFLVGICS